MYKTVSAQIKEEILHKIKEGGKVQELADQYGISSKTIYAWLRSKVKPEINIAAFNKLKKENEELKRLVGMMVLDLEEQKKRKLSKNVSK